MVKPRKKITKKQAVKLKIERKKRQTAYTDPPSEADSSDQDRLDNSEDEEEHSDGRAAEEHCVASCTNPECHNFSIQALEDFSLPINAVLVRTFFARTAPITRSLFEGHVVDKYNKPYGPLKSLPVNHEYCIVNFRNFSDLLRVARDNVIIVDGINYTASVFPVNLGRKRNIEAVQPLIFQETGLFTTALDTQSSFSHNLRSYHPCMDQDKYARYERMIM